MADEAREVAAGLRNPELRRQMLLIAAKYDALAKRTESFAKIAAVANSYDPAKSA
jgi:hypothetical protein